MLVTQTKAMPCLAEEDWEGIPGSMVRVISLLVAVEVVDSRVVLEGTRKEAVGAAVLIIIQTCTMRTALSLMVVQNPAQALYRSLFHLITILRWYLLTTQS